MDEFIIIIERLQQVHTLDEFRGTNHKAIMNMPYYRRLSSGELLFDFIRKETNGPELEHFIGEGVIYRLADLNISGEGTDADRTAQPAGEL